MATVYARTPDGQIVQGPEENLAQLQANVPGAVPLTPAEADAELAKAQMREEESGLAGAAKQFVSSAIEGGTMLPIAQGLERAYGRVTGGEKGEQEAIERMRVREEQQQAAAFAGSALGFGAGVFTGAAETGALARLGTFGARGVMNVGARAAEKATARMAEDSLKRAIVGATARGATEGALLGTGQLAKDAVLGQDITPELVTERLVGGALLGGAGGALFEGLGAAASSAAQKVGAESVGTMVGAAAGAYVGGIPGAIGGGVVGRKLGGFLGRSAAAGERAAIQELTDREARAAQDAAGEVARRDMTAAERRAVLDADRAEMAGQTVAREEELAGGLDAAEDELQRQRRAAYDAQLRDNYAAAEDMTPRVEELARLMQDENSELAKAARAELANATKTVDEVALEIGKHRDGLMAKVLRGVQAAKEGVTGEAKRAQVFKLATEIPAEEAASLVKVARQRIGEELTSFAQQLETDIADLPGLRNTFGKQVAQLRKAATAVERGVFEENPHKALAEIHHVGDMAKREVDNILSRGPGGTASLDERSFFRKYRTGDGATGLRSALTDESIFGEGVASLQSEVNQGWRKSIPELVDTSRRYMREGLDPNEIDPFEIDKIVDPAKIIPQIKSIGTPEQAANLETLRRFVESQKKFQRTAAERFDLSPTQRARVTESLQALDKMGGALDRITTASRALEAARFLKEDALEQLKIGVAGKIPGIGQAVTMMLDLERRATMERALAGLVGNADKRINDAVNAFVRGAERPGRLIAEAARGAAVEAGTKPAPQIKPKEAVAKELATTAPRETREAMAKEALKQIATVTAVVGTPGALDTFAFAGTGPMQFTSDPRLAASVANASARAMAFLYQKRPPTFESDTLQPDLVARQLSDGQLATWRAYAMTAAKPLSVLDDLERGTVRREQVETLRALYPAIYSAIQSRILDTLHSTRAQISFPQRVLLFQLFGSATDPSLRPQTIAGIQASFAPVQPSPQVGAPRATPGRVRGSFAADLRTSTESLAARGKMP
jgi:hypothetical protein